MGKCRTAIKRHGGSLHVRVDDVAATPITAERGSLLCVTNARHLLFAALAAFAGIGSWADTHFDSTYGIEWSYSINEDGNTATIDGAWRSLTGPDPYIPMYYSDWDGYIPSEVAGYTVTAIADNASFDSGLTYSNYGGAGVTSIYIPDTIKYIGDYAFSSLSDIWYYELPDGLEYLGYQAFNTSNMSGESVGDNYEIHAINGWVYRQDMSGRPHAIDLSSAKGIMGGAFENCTVLRSVILPNAIKNVASGTFLGCTKLTEIVIPATVESIGRDAFNGAESLTNITFLGNAPQVYDDAFCNVSQGCVVYVRQGTTGWGTVPGTWNGLPVKYATTPSSYTVTWLDEDGTMIDTTEYVPGATPSHANPTKTSTAQYSYTFEGWTPEIESVLSNTTYTAQYTAHLRAYYVYWQNENGKQLAKTLVNYGSMPYYSGTPTKNETTLYAYEFAGWTPALVLVEGEATYRATFTEIAKYEGSGTVTDPYVVTDKASFVSLFSLGGSLFVKLSPELAMEGPVTVPASVTSLSIDMNGGTIAGTSGSAAIVLVGNTAFSAKGTGTISADAGIEAVQRPGSVTMAPGVTLTGMGGGASFPAPEFAAGGDAATTRFVQGENGKWTITMFAELANDALGADVADGQIKVYAADTIQGLKTASPMTGGVEIKEKKSAVKTTIEVTPPGGSQSQFFKVKFGE